MKIFFQDKEYKRYDYLSEDEFEKDVISNSKKFFGEKTIYVDFKKRLKGKYGDTIPDGYLFDYTFTDKPVLYFIENERLEHGVREHIVPQLLKFQLNYRNNMMLLKNTLIDKIIETGINLDEIAKGYNYRNADDMLTDVISKEALNIIVPIDEINDELRECISYLNLNIELKEFKKYTCGDSVLFMFEPLNEEIEFSAKKLNVKNEELDTVIVPASEDGFNKVFLGENAWYEISIGINMLDKLKYIVAYQKKPVGAVKYYAEISKIEPYKDSGKYIIYFKESAKKLPYEIKLNPNNPFKAPQSRVYTSFNKIINANEYTTLDDIF